jgi:hypothetical protein
MLDTETFSDVPFANIFSVSCLFTLLMVSFHEKQILVLIKYNFF